MSSRAYPPYTVRHSPRAKYARLVFTHDKGLIVVVPRGFDLALIPQILHRNRQWLERAAQWAKAQSRCYGDERTGEPPASLALPAIGEQWELEYREADAPRTLIIEHGSKLLLFGDNREVTAATAALKAWLMMKARRHLKPWLLRLARLYGFDVQSVSIRAQRSRWASCSSTKTISLNVKLLFLPPQLVEYTMLHELCHTKYMNHSQQFWKLVRAHDSDYLAKDQQLKAAWQLVPPWLEEG